MKKNVNSRNQDYSGENRSARENEEVNATKPESTYDDFGTREGRVRRPVESSAPVEENEQDNSFIPPGERDLFPASDWERPRMTDPLAVGQSGQTRLEGGRQTADLGSELPNDPRSGEAAWCEPKQAATSESLKRTRHPQTQRKQTGKHHAAWLLAGLIVLGLVFFVYLLFNYAFGGFNTRNFLPGQKSALNSANRATPAPTVTPLPEVVKQDSSVHNILLVGSDTRHKADDDSQRSDTMMILTIDMKNKALRLLSIQRDTMVYINGDPKRLARINAAYDNGINTLISTINANFSLHVKDYLAVDMAGTAAVIDLMKGIQIDIPNNQEFIDGVNACIDEQNHIFTTAPSPLIERGGKQLLNGNQALGYMRVREVDSDYARSERQRETVTLLFDKFRKMDPVAQLSLVREGAQYMSSNLSVMDLINLARQVMPVLGDQVKTMQIPATGDYWENDDYDILPALNLLIPHVQAFIYGQDLKTPPVREIPGAPKVKADYYIRPGTRRYLDEISAQRGISEEEARVLSNKELERQRAAGYTG